MWKLKDNAEGNDKFINSNKIKDSLEALRGVISEIKFIEVGINIKEGEQAYDVVLNSEFNNLEELDKYQKNPEHLKVAGFIGKVADSRVVVDYEF
ncbi:Putative Stress responsive A/B barrel domain protein [Clostridium chauvoei JF4335]|nr:Putative Stress responsive A/B barrel domain protein [Clostridium chauvoei JF4335]